MAREFLPGICLMLISQYWGSLGVASDTVNIVDFELSNARDSGICHSGVKFGLNGVLSAIQPNGGFSVRQGEWLVSGTASTFFVKRTIISGTLEVDAGAGFLQLNAARIYANHQASAGSKTTVVFFELSSDMTGVPIVDTATMTFISEQGFQ